MSQHFKQTPHNAISESGIARVLPCKQLTLADPIKWLSFAWQDVLKAPGLSLFYGVAFAITPWFITYLVAKTGWHLVILPAVVCFMLVGPVLAAGLYDISWELEKGHKPQLSHTLMAMKRNAVNSWGFSLLLMIFMIFWLRIASLIHALYPPGLEYSLENLLPFLALGTGVGILFTFLVFMLTAFTQPILMERKVDLATALLSSINAVWLNKLPMLLWGALIFICVLVGFVTGFFAFILLMPIIGYASWHGYIDTIETKRERKFQ